MNIRLISSFVLFFLLIFGPLEVHSSGFSPRRSFLVPRIRSPPNHSSISRHSETRIRPNIIPRGGQDLEVFSDDDDEIQKDEPGIGGFVRLIGTVTQVLISCGKAVLPPAVAGIKGIIGFYRALPIDAVIAQVGLVYCFAGGYYPTLFSSLQAAEHCGWRVMLHAIDDLTEEAIKVINATADLSMEVPERKDLFIQQTNIVLKTVDPMKVNQAAAALYTTWLGVSAVLEKEYVRVISLSMTLADYFERIAHFLLEPPVKMCVSEEYHRWVPVVIGWGCKGVAMNIGWRLQRVLTASTSAMYGGVMFSRSLLRMFSTRGIRFFGLIPSYSKNSPRDSPLEDIIGFMVAGFGFYTQIESQYRTGFSFQVPFPLSLLTWPFDFLERWIQWQITK